MRVKFRHYALNDKDKCLTLFDMNCPEYFAPNERIEYEQFLDINLAQYQLCEVDNAVVGAFGMSREQGKKGRLEWIMLDPGVQGNGIGNAVMDRVIVSAGDAGLESILIATSHKAYRFFAKRGAVIVSQTENGWGPGMHRVDMELIL